MKRSGRDYHSGRQPNLLEGVWTLRLGWEFHDASPEGVRLIAQGISPGEGA